MTYQFVLSIYEHDVDYTYPTRNEVIICNNITSREQVPQPEFVECTPHQIGHDEQYPTVQYFGIPSILGELQH